jgi:hypothetical protein
MLIVLFGFARETKADIPIQPFLSVDDAEACQLVYNPSAQLINPLPMDAELEMVFTLGAWIKSVNYPQGAYPSGVSNINLGVEMKADWLSQIGVVENLESKARFCIAGDCTLWSDVDQSTITNNCAFPPPPPPPPPLPLVLASPKLVIPPEKEACGKAIRVTAEIKNPFDYTADLELIRDWDWEKKHTYNQEIPWWSLGIYLDRNAQVEPGKNVINIWILSIPDAFPWQDLWFRLKLVLTSERGEIIESTWGKVHIICNSP